MCLQGAAFRHRGEAGPGRHGLCYSLDEGRQPPAAGAPLPGGGEEGLEPVAHDLVEEGLLGLPPVVRAELRAGGANMALPGLDRAGGVLHAGSQGKPRAETAPRRR